MRPSAIGFDLPGDPANARRGVEKQAEELTRLASSLLLYQSVLRGKPAQAVLSTLVNLAGGSARAVESYGEAFRLLAADGFGSWQDYVLEQILRAVDNPFSRAAARGEDTTHLLAAAAADLDALQKLALNESTLSAWVHDSVPGLPEEWLEAASSLKLPYSPAHNGATGGPACFRLPEGPPPPALLGALSEAQRAAARDCLGSSRRWGEAAQDLARFYAAYGHGLLPNHRVLGYAGKLEGQDALKGVNALAQAADQGLVAHEHHATRTLVAALSAFLAAPLDPNAACQVPPHAAVVGSPRDRWLHTTYVLESLPHLVDPSLAEAAGGLRAVLLPSSQLPALADLAWSLANHPRCRFVVLASGVESSSVKNEVQAILSGYGGFSWPPNAVMLAGFEVAVPEELKSTFAEQYTASIESINYCA